MADPFAYGVRLVTALPMASMPQSNADGPSVTIDVTRCGTLPALTETPANAYPAQGRMMEVHVSRESITVVVAGLLHFHLYLDRSHIDCLAAAGTTDELIRYWLLQQIIPMLLLFNGSTELLHATSVDTPLGAVAFLGPSHVGKSTLLHYCLAQGNDLITDEHLAIERTHVDEAVPSIPFYRPYRSLEDLGLRAERFAAKPARLRRLYILEPAVPNAPVTAEPLTGTETVSAVMMNQQYNVFTRRYEHLQPILAKRFAGLAALTRRVPVRRLRVPRDLTRLPDVYEFIQHDLAS